MIDRDILRLLAERRTHSREAARLKKVDWSHLRDRGREESLLVDMIHAARVYHLDSYFVTRIFHEIIDDSLRIQQQYLQERVNVEDREALIRIAFQGIEGAFSHLAARQYFSPMESKISYLSCGTFREVMEAVESGRADYGMLPIENTTSGGINEVYDLLLHTQLSIVGEEKCKVVHCLVGLKPASLEGIKRIYCHPQAALQCSSFLEGFQDCHIEYFADTALSGKKIKEDDDRSQAAIASEEAARIFGLAIIQHNIANQEENYTRFLVAARKSRKVDMRIPCKTSIVMYTTQHPGSLVEALLVFRENGINLTKLESRPVMGNPWEEMFYVDFEGNIEDERVERVLDDLTRRVRFIKVLGCYPTREFTPTNVTQAQACAFERQGEDSEEKLVTKITRSANQSTPQAVGYRLGSREYKEQDTVIDIRGITIGGGTFTVIAGPCSIESMDQIAACALEAKEHGAQILRGGCFKPRTSPYSFQGLGYEGLDMLVEAGKKYGLPVVTEVLSPDDVDKVAGKADILQIGARNMQNFKLLAEAGKTQKPVMLKRGMSSSIGELLQAAEYILAEGNQQVFLCERGIRTFETATRSTLDLSAVPVLKSRTHLPVVVDPSHAAGDRELVLPLALAAKAVGADGLMVEIHPDPDIALSDGPQSLRFSQFEELMGELLM
jgi:chorismate mutase/prephenate dehydratase